MKPYEIHSMGYLANRDAYLIGADFLDGIKIEALVPATGLGTYDLWEFEVFENGKHLYTFESQHQCASDSPERTQPSFGGLKDEEVLSIFEDAYQNYQTRIGA